MVNKRIIYKKSIECVSFTLKKVTHCFPHRESNPDHSGENAES